MYNVLLILHFYKYAIYLQEKNCNVELLQWYYKTCLFWGKWMESHDLNWIILTSNGMNYRFK